jgi:murein DD-endopeptidase MepM/ murein hydrolase activator NlpD
MGVRRHPSPLFSFASIGLAAFMLALVLARPAPSGGNTAPVREHVPVRYEPTDRYDRYVEILRQAGADGAALGRDWLAAGESVLQTALPVDPPFRETGWFDPSRADAIGYRFDVPRGQRVEIQVDLEADGPQRLFVDLFRLADDGLEPPVHVASGAGEERRVELQVVDDSSYLLRVQPELLRGGRFTVTIRNLAFLRFPVVGRTSSAILSAFGVDRDGGRRLHRGVDIFAPRGTPVIAGADGVAVWVGESGRGGKVVWLELDGGHNLYYAHLDAQAVEEGQAVRAGDVVGWVGNTGNARTTPPHLHFGVYLDVRDAVDPYPFVHEVDSTPADIVAATATLGAWARTTHGELDLRSGPARRATRLSVVGTEVPVLLEGASGDQYRVRLPDDTVGYLAAAAVAPIDAALESTASSRDVALRARPVAGAAIVDQLAAGTELPVMGRFGDWSWVSTPTGHTGWLSLGSDD